MADDAMQKALRHPMYQSGKGSGDRSTFLPAFQENFDSIAWTPKEISSNGVPAPKKTRKVYGPKATPGTRRVSRSRR